MSDYRLRTDDGDVVDSATHPDDQSAIAWRSSRPFTAPSTHEGRQLRLDKQLGDHWVEIDALGTADVS